MFSVHLLFWVCDWGVELVMFGFWLLSIAVMCVGVFGAFVLGVLRLYIGLWICYCLFVEYCNGFL